MKKLLSMLAALALCITLSGCANEEETVSISMSGSTSVEKFAKSLAEAYMEDVDADVTVQGGGSSAGVPNVVDGISNVGLLSRNLKDSEKEAGLTEYIVAIDGIAVTVHKDNTVNDLTLEEINKIYSGQVTNWSEVGGPDLEIVLVGREAGSGTRDGFESVVDLDEVKADQEFNETGQVIAAVEATPGAIGYISTAYINNADKVITVDGVEATTENIQSQAYPLQRNFIMVTNGDDAGVEAFMEFVLSAEGQEIAELSGCVPVK